MNALLFVSPVGLCSYQLAQEIITWGQINLPLGPMLLLNIYIYILFYIIASLMRGLAEYSVMRGLCYGLI